MGVVIHGTSKATCTQRILATLIEKGVTDYELKTVNMKAGEHKVYFFPFGELYPGAEYSADPSDYQQPEYLKKQPFGVIPVLEDGDFLLHGRFPPLHLLLENIGILIVCRITSNLLLHRIQICRPRRKASPRRNRPQRKRNFPKMGQC